jgi:hypothetical protein
VQGQQPAPLKALQPEQVNLALEAKGLSPLNLKEMKLLKEVNGKIAVANGMPEPKVEIPPELLAGPAADSKILPKAALPNGAQPVEAAKQNVVPAKGGDPRKEKMAESSVQGAPEKIVTTETYLQMHDSANAVNANGLVKPQAKEQLAKQPQPDTSFPIRADGALTASSVAASGAQKEPNLGSRKGDEGKALDKDPNQAKLDATAAAGGFGGALATKSEVVKHDVYLPGPDKPEQRTNMLLAEVGSGVALHAHKGGGEMRLVIHPDDLGEVKLKVGTKNGKVEVQIVAENEEVAKMIRNGSKDLETSLRDQNLSLAKFEVSVSDPSSVASTDSRSGFSEQFLSQNQQQPQHGSSFLQSGMGDEGRGARWGAEQGGHQGGGGYFPSAEDSGRLSARNSLASAPKSLARAPSGSRRLDVVA